MPTSDPSHGLFKRRREIDLPGGERERTARELAFRGLLRIEERTFVRCVNPLDPDQKYLKDRHCDGRVYVQDRLDDSNGDYRCPSCGRQVYLHGKRKMQSIRLFPDDVAITTLIEAKIRAAGFAPVERPLGLYRVVGDTGQAEVCVVDRCSFAPVFMDNYPVPLVFVVVDDGFLPRVDRHADVYRFADLALGNAGQRLQRRLRELVRGDADGALPAVRRIPVGPVAAAPPALLKTKPAALAPREATWDQIELFYIDGDTIAYRVPGERARRLTFSEFPGSGMADNRGSSRTKQWDLLVALCEGKGRLPWTGTPKERNAFKERVSQLRKCLQAAFGINGNPLKLSTADGLSAAFKAFPHAPGDRPAEDALESEYPF